MWTVWALQQQQRPGVLEEVRGNNRQEQRQWKRCESGQGLNAERQRGVKNEKNAANNVSQR